MDLWERGGDPVRVLANIQLEFIEWRRGEDGIVRAATVLRDLDSGETVTIPGGPLEVREP